MLALYPARVWYPSATALTLVAVTTPAIIYLAVSPPTSWAQATTIAQLVVAPACVVAAVLLYFTFRMSELPALAWMVLCMTVYAVEGVTVGLIRASGSGYFDRSGWILLIDLAVAVAVAAVAIFARDRGLRWDPLATGILTGAVVAFTHLELKAAGPVIAHHLPIPAIGAAVLALWLFAAFRLVRCAVVLPLWMTQRVALGFVLLTMGRVVVVQDFAGAVLNTGAIVSLVAGAVILLSSTTASLRFEIQRQRHRLEQLDAQVARMEAQHAEQRSRLHEIANSVASIAGASKIMHERAHLPAHSRARFEEMLDAESARLARILGRSTTASTDAEGLLALDDLIRPLVSAQEVVGRRVEWSPTGRTALGFADDVTEALNVLLDNARKHAPGGTTTVSVRPAGSCVEIVVADDGPGIAPDAREVSFAAGHRGPASHGQGLGLHLARTRLGHSAGSLALAPTERGSTFVVRLRAGRDDEARHAEVKDAS